ncbi:hypothetical protein PSA7680_03249 [Pseudoruegeria aquimaris]|uniref:Uncharacterized protein n=1 Tax=Pseudoruegeria aquimaris TaxID=393663 RepID=A0A1Y5TE12_9RHOB|nr:hypothetical protein [Pseudoruegeria aquimaris]SLN61722.1 hypothetical protein PSA7680_03249 [Pseudoruegeria aquimaris]
MREHPVKPVENYTTPFLVSAGVLLFSTLLVIWAWLGLLAALAISWAMNKLLDWRRARA